MGKLKKIGFVQQKHSVYDIEVEDNHNFFANGILAHNCEISLKPYQFCNLTEVNAAGIESQVDFNSRVRAATILGTLQATYTNFHYLRDNWKSVTEKDALLGVSLTGIGSGAIKWLDEVEAARVAVETNKEWAKKLKIKQAARVTTLKPSGCVDPETKIRTSIGDITLKHLFELNGYDLAEFSDRERLFLPVTEKIMVKDLEDNWQQVEQLYINGMEEVLEFEFEDGTKVECTGNHKFLTETGWVRADELTKDHSLIKY